MAAQTAEVSERIAPKLGTITRQNGVAGQFSYTVPVTYPGKSTRRIRFVGSAYGWPVVMVTSENHQTFVSAPERFGPKLSPAWVRAFFK